ncbi:MAG: type II toxin-antitoxin system HicB family antitoxin [Candidatus Eremiobacteraeota bacterium]|nr:type II toxin-antitoxin system HicB family antitoxin [Candidatus Eremiobacteraeota bacterium]
MLRYPARFIPAEEGGFIVEFPDLPGCHTEGDTLEEAKAMAKEALTGWLESVYSRELKIPDPSDIKGNGIYYVAPEPEIEIPIMIRKIRIDKGLSQKEIADAIGIKYQTYQRFENPGKFNATVKNLKRISRALGKELEIVIK